MIEWASGWRLFENEKRRRYFEGELRWELAENPQHVLAGRQYEAVGLYGVWDDIIVRLDCRDEFAWVHLAWNRENQPAWPHCQLLGGMAELNQFIATWEPLPERMREEEDGF